MLIVIYKLIQLLSDVIKQTPIIYNIGERQTRLYAVTISDGVATLFININHIIYQFLLQSLR